MSLKSEKPAQPLLLIPSERKDCRNVNKKLSNVSRTGDGRMRAFLPGPATAPEYYSLSCSPTAHGEFRGLSWAIRKPAPSSKPTDHTSRKVGTIPPGEGWMKMEGTATLSETHCTGNIPQNTNKRLIRLLPFVLIRKVVVP